MNKGKKVLSYIVKVLILLIYVGVSLYLVFPALHFQNRDAMMWLASVVLVAFLDFGCAGYFKRVFEGLFPQGASKGAAQGYVKKEKLPVSVKILLVVICLFGVYFVGGEISSMKVFRAKDYAAQMEMQEMEIKDF